MRSNLTELGIQSLKPHPSRKQHTAWDTVLRGFGCRVSLHGTKSWVIMTGRDRRLTTFGRWPEMNLKTARIEARKLLTAPPAPKERLTLEKALETFLEASKATTRERTREDYRGWIERNFFPTLKTRDVAKITTDELMEIVDGLGDKPTEQMHAFNVSKTLFRFLLRRKLIPHNPLDGLRMKSRPLSRDRVLSPEELAAIQKACAEDPYSFDHITLLTMYLGQRKGEIAQMEWDWINQQERTITFPSTVTKNKWQHVIKYPSQVQDILNAVPKRDGVLFPGRHEGTFQGFSRGKANFDKKCTVRNWGLHDLRRSLSSHMAGTLKPPVDQIVVEKLLNHRSQGAQSPIASVYNRYKYFDEGAEALQRYADWLGSLVR